MARPPRILGPGDRENLVFFRLVKRGIRLEIGGGPRPLSVVDVDDVVEALLLLAVRPEAVGEAFFTPGPDQTTLEEIQSLGAEVLGVRPRTLRLSPRRLQALATMADGFSRLTGKHLPLNRKLARQLLAPAWTCSGEKARARLGWIAPRSTRAPRLPGAPRGIRPTAGYERQGSFLRRRRNAGADEHRPHLRVLRDEPRLADRHRGAHPGHGGADPGLRRAGPDQPEGLQRVLLPGLRGPLRGPAGGARRGAARGRAEAGHLSQGPGPHRRGATGGLPDRADHRGARLHRRSRLPGTSGPTTSSPTRCSSSAGWRRAR